MASEYKNKFPIFWVLIIVILLIDFGIVFFINRAGGWSKIFMWYFITLVILFLIGLVIAAVVWLFMPHRRSNIVYMKNQIIKACSYGARDGEQRLYFQGTDALSNRQIGFMQGVCAVKSEPKIAINKPEDKEELNALIPESIRAPKTEEISPAKTLIFISFTRNKPSFLSGLFGSPEVAAVLEEDIIGGLEGLNWDIVRLKDSAFTIPIGQIFYLKKYYQETQVADEVTGKIIYRYQLIDNLDQLKTLTDAFLNLNPKFRAEQEANNLQILSGQGAKGGVTQVSGG